MKNLFKIVMIFCILLVIVPSIILFKHNNNPKPSLTTGYNITSSDFVEPKTYKMLDKQTNKVIEIPLRDYLIGAVCAQMPVSFENEALKAQVVIAHTYILNRHLKEMSKPDNSLIGADFSNDFTKYDPYYTIEQIKKLYQNDYEASYKKISSIVDDVINDIICYNNNPIIPVFHSISQSKTESAQNIWGEDISYLKSVETYTDDSINELIKNTTISKDEFSARLSAEIPSLKLEGEPQTWIKKIDKTDIGTVLNLEICNVNIKGTDFSKILSLSSERFDIKFENNNFTFIYKSIGHGVGLSQYGALKMAKDGKNYKDILTHYYSNTSIYTLK